MQSLNTAFARALNFENESTGDKQPQQLIETNKTYAFARVMCDSSETMANNIHAQDLVAELKKHLKGESHLFEFQVQILKVSTNPKMTFTAILIKPISSSNEEGN